MLIARHTSTTTITMSHPRSLHARLHRSHIEPLETRIAPALLVNGANLLGAGGPTTGEASVGDNSLLFVKVFSGQALVWFDGQNITSISVGPGAKLEVHGSIGAMVHTATGSQFVAGDIIANLTASGTLSDSDNNPLNGEDGGVLLANDILGVTVLPIINSDGSVGHIITGGSVSNVDVAGTINGVYAGDGVFRTESAFGGSGTISVAVGIDLDQTQPGVQTAFDINPIAPGVQTDFVLHKSAAVYKSGASINQLDITVGQNLEIFSGNGSPSGAAVSGTAVSGGSITNVKIGLAKVAPGSPLNTPSYHLITGDGGDGKVAGSGGSILNVVEESSSGPVVMTTGKGGFGNGGAGGAGGNIVGVDAQSPSSQYFVTTGVGGAGTPGGAGGKISNGNFSNRTPIAGVLISADFDGDHFDDVLVADSGTGSMVLNINQGLSGGFQEKPQIGADTTIASGGAGPVDGLAVDVDGDGDKDAVILYRDGSMSAFLNQGGGVFYDAGKAEFAIASMTLGFTPSKFSYLGNSVYAVAENKDGKGTLHGVGFQVDSGTGALFAETYAVDLTFNRPIADVAGNYVGLSDGNIEQFQAGFSGTQKALFSVQKIKPVISGGLDDLDLDSTGTHLLALSSAGRALAVYDVSTNTAVALPSVSLASVPGKPVQAKFIDNSSSTDDDIIVLGNTVDQTEFALLNPPPAPASGASQTKPYTVTSVSETQALLKNFSPLYDPNGGQPSLVALAGTLNKFTEITNLTFTEDFALPFASKQVTLTTGDGGAGVDAGAKLGKGGAGGSIASVNVEAQTINYTTGKGGNSNNGAAGAGGSVTNNGVTFKSAGGSTVLAKLSADLSLEIALGNGGTPMGSGGKSASGGAGGGIQGLDLTLTSGDIILATGGGGAGNGGNGGAGGDVSKLTLHGQQGGLTLTTGQGGAANGAGGGAGGAGGSINSLTYSLKLNADAEKVEQSYAVSITTGFGGNSVVGLGGNGGDVGGVSLTLDGPDLTFDNPGAVPPETDTHNDSTIVVTVTAGDAGHGGKGGGAGGNIRSFTSDTVFDQFVGSQPVLNYVVEGLFAGKGGDSANGNGGAGGAITLTRPISGVTGPDPDMPGLNLNIPALQLVGGAGGNGALAGGVGGSVSGLSAQNVQISGKVLGTTMLFSLGIAGGDGGNGGNGNGGDGGGVANVLAGVNGGFLDVFGGHGGTSANAKGGAGGTVSNSELGLVFALRPVGMDIEGGIGGSGKTAGGVGGMLSGLRISTPQSTSNLSAILFGGDGGAANSATGVGGKGGDVSGITQAKDYNSSINVIQAGNGGDNLLGKGGAGGNVLNIRTVGFIGRPSNSDGDQLGVFDGPFAQGVFAGRGGDGVTDGINGSISNVVARQIAAMAAAMDYSTGLFAAATKISNVTASLIGFDVNGNGIFDTEGAPGATPSGTVPVDGFILAAALSKVSGSRPAFTFAS